MSFGNSTLASSSKCRTGVSTTVWFVSASVEKSKNKWEQTTWMDSFTSTEFNEIGRSSSDKFIISEYQDGHKEIDDKPEKLF